MYLPPECIYYNEETNVVQPKTFSIDVSLAPIIDDLPYTLIPASTSHDAWALGVVLYHIFSGEPFLLANDEDNIDDKQLRLIYEYSDGFKRDRMSKIQNVQARNLVSQLLTKDPRLRPTMDRAILHPFLSGKAVVRMAGNCPEYDFFLSYRVSSDSTLVEFFYNRFTAMGYRVWW